MLALIKMSAWGGVEYLPLLRNTVDCAILNITAILNSGTPVESAHKCIATISSPYDIIVTQEAHIKQKTEYNLQEVIMTKGPTWPTGIIEKNMSRNTRNTMKKKL